MENTMISSSISSVPIVSTGPFLVDSSDNSISGVIVIGMGISDDFNKKQKENIEVLKKLKVEENEEIAEELIEELA